MGATLKRREGSRLGAAGVSATFCTILLCAFCTSFRAFSDVFGRFRGVSGKFYHCENDLNHFRRGHYSRTKKGWRGVCYAGRLSTKRDGRQVYQDTRSFVRKQVAYQALQDDLEDLRSERLAIERLSGIDTD